VIYRAHFMANSYVLLHLKCDLNPNPNLNSDDARRQK